MTKDYTKLLKKKESISVGKAPEPASVTSPSGATRKAQAEHICVQCYETGHPIENGSGSWTGYFFKLFVIAIIAFFTVYTYTTSLKFSFAAAAAAILLSTSSLGGGTDEYDSLSNATNKNSEIDESLAPILSFPVKLLKCRHCRHPSSMVKIDSREGQDAMFFALKKKKPNNDF